MRLNISSLTFGFLLCLCFLALSSWNTNVYPRYAKTSLPVGHIVERKDNQAVIGFPIITKDSLIVKSYAYNMFLVPWPDVEYVQIQPLSKTEYNVIMKQFKGVK